MGWGEVGVNNVKSLGGDDDGTFDVRISTSGYTMLIVNGLPGTSSGPHRTVRL